MVLISSVIRMCSSGVFYYIVIVVLVFFIIELLFLIFWQVTASLGDDSHMFLRSRDRRLHYNGGSGVFMVRNAGHSAGFDEEGELRIF